MKAFIASFVLLGSLAAAAEDLYLPTAGDLVNCKERIIENAEKIITSNGQRSDAYKISISVEKSRVYMSPRNEQTSPYFRGHDIYLLERGTCKIKLVVDSGGVG